jgi:transposase
MTAKAEFPAGISAPVRSGYGPLARAAYLDLYQLLPVARTSEALRDLFGCPLSPATVERAGRLFPGNLVRSERRLRAAVGDAPVVGADETGLRVAGRGGWVHVARTDDPTHFAYDSRRGLDAMRGVGILPQFRGTLVRDGHLSYPRFEHCRHGLCNAHLLREPVFVAESDPAQAAWTEPLAALLLEIKEAAARACAAGRGRLGEEAGGTYLRRYARLVNRLSRRRDEVLRFMSDLAVPFTNNGAERDLRMVKVQQKVPSCFRTEEGARDFCRVRSYLSTARKQGHPLLHALERVLAGKPLPLVPSPV